MTDLLLDEEAEEVQPGLGVPHVPLKLRDELAERRPGPNRVVRHAGQLVAVAQLEQRAHHLRTHAHIRPESSLGNYAGGVP